MDKIHIIDLEVMAHIGVTDQERETPQKLLISIEIERDLAEAGRTDTESTTTGYDQVVDVVGETVAHRPRKLIEAMANDIAWEILARKWAVAVTVEVKKFSIPAARYVSVEIYRRQ